MENGHLESFNGRLRDECLNVNQLPFTGSRQAASRRMASGLQSLSASRIHDAIARKLNEKGKLSKNAIAEGIINNVRKTIIREQLTDPRFYEQMSKLLADLIKQTRADATAYEEFLQKAEALVKRLAAKQTDEGVPAAVARQAGGDGDLQQPAEDSRGGERRGGWGG